MRNNGHDIIGTAVRKPLADVPAYRDNNEEADICRKIRNRKLDKKVKFRLVVLSVLLFTVCVAVAYRYAIITEQAFSINHLNKTYEDLVNSNVKLQAENDKKIDLNKIKLLAETKLAMQKPGKSQIIYVKIPKTDYATVTPTEKFAFTTNLKARLTALFSTLY